MRRSASEIIRNLERRIARLEKSASNKGNYAFGMLPESEREKAELHYSLADWFESNGILAFCGAPADDNYWCELDATPEEVKELVGRKLRGRGKFFMYKGMEYGIFTKQYPSVYLKRRGVKGLTTHITLADGSSMAMRKSDVV